MTIPKSIPLIRLLIPFLLGVISALFFPAVRGFSLPVVALISGILIVIQLVIFLKKVPYRYRWLPGVIITFIVFLLGIGTVLGSDRKPDHNQGVLWYAKIVDVPQRSFGSVRLQVRLFRLDSATRMLLPDVGAMVYLESDTAAETLFYGDCLLLAASFDSIPGAMNPYGWDARSGYLNKGITHQSRLKRHQWMKTRWNEPVSVKGTASRYREKMRHILIHNGMTGDELAVASALLLGDTRDIDSDLRKGYAACGAMHILAVSGMHVGIIYLFLDFLLGFLKRWNAGRWIRTVILLLGIWGYAFITGLSPSVFRAALMLSFVVVALSLHRHPDMFNVLAASMFVILIFDPRLLLNLGFQFSYLAVAGILLLYKPLNGLWQLRYWILKKIWSLMAVSIAAQLATFPLALYVFHQFPNYFLLTNVVVAPLSSVIIYSGVVLLMVSFYSPVAWLAAQVLKSSVWFLNHTVQAVEGLPGAISTDIFYSGLDLLLLYLLLASAVLFLFSKRTRWLFCGLTVTLLFSLSLTCRLVAQSRSDEMVIFSVRGGTVMTFRSGLQMLVVGDSAGLHSPYARQLIHQYAGYECVNQQVNKPVQDTGFLAWSWQGKRIGVISREIPEKTAGTLPLDMVVLIRNPAVSLSVVMQKFSPEQIIIDGSNSFSAATAWKDEAAGEGLPCHWVSEAGAFRQKNVTGKENKSQNSLLFDKIP